MIAQRRINRAPVPMDVRVDQPPPGAPREAATDVATQAAAVEQAPPPATIEATPPPAFTVNASPGLTAARPTQVLRGPGAWRIAGLVVKADDTAIRIVMKPGEEDSGGVALEGATLVLAIDLPDGRELFVIASVAAPLPASETPAAAAPQAPATPPPQDEPAAQAAEPSSGTGEAT